MNVLDGERNKNISISITIYYKIDIYFMKMISPEFHWMYGILGTQWNSIQSMEFQPMYGIPSHNYWINYIRLLVVFAI